MFKNNMINRKSKGTNAERNLIKLFHDHGWSALRSAGSGSSKYPSPDVLAGNGFRRIALECKTTKDNKKYLKNDEVEQLMIFSKNFGAEPWIALKFPAEQWYFFMIEDLKKTPNSYVGSLEDTKFKALTFNELIENI